MKTPKKYSGSSKKARSNRKSLMFLVLAGGLLIALAAVLYARHNSSGKSNNLTPDTTTNAKGEGPTTPVQTPTNNNKGQSVSPSPVSDSTPPASPETLKNPYGNFVSSHTAYLSSKELSTCITSVGATCSITFSKDGVTKSLGEKTVDSDGTAYWGWKPEDLQLTYGDWKITAIASHNGKTASVVDPQSLVVHQ